MGIARIIALDLGKFKTVACVVDAAADRSHVFELQRSPVHQHFEVAAPHAPREVEDDHRVIAAGPDRHFSTVVGHVDAGQILRRCPDDSCIRVGGRCTSGENGDGE